MASSNVSSFLREIGQGVKPNMFEVEINFPNQIGGGKELDLTNLLCRSAALPGSNLGVIEVPFRGRTVKIAGDRTFDTWSTTFFNDKDFKLRSYFEQWANQINTHNDNTAPLFTPNADGYMADLKVKQLEKGNASTGDNGSGAILRVYTLKHCFPTNVSPIDLAYDSNDQIEEFSVEWQYSYFTADSQGGRSNVSSIGVE